MYSRDVTGCYTCSPCCFPIAPKNATGRKDGKGYASVTITPFERRSYWALGASIGVGDIIGGVGGDIISIVDSKVDLDLSGDYYRFLPGENARGITEEMEAMTQCPKSPEGDKTFAETTLDLPNTFKCKTRND